MEGGAGKGWRAFFTVALLVSATLILAGPSQLLAQNRIHGVITEEGSGTPLRDVVVKLESNGAAVLTDAEGRFEMHQVPDGLQVLVLGRLGLERALVPFMAPSPDPLEIQMRLDPVELDGLVIGQRSFEERYEEAIQHLDARVARLPGQMRSVEGARIERYDSIYEKNPWALVSRELGASWVFEEDSFRLFARKVKPEVYIDEKRKWLFQVLEEQPSTFCRIEVYMPPRSSDRLDDRPPQLRAYTCDFLDEVAHGAKTLSKYLSTGDLIAGPNGGRGG